MESPNRMALDLVDEAIDFADELRVGVRHVEGDATVLDFGVDHPGGVEAGLLLAEVATGGIATVGTYLGTVADAPLTHVELATDHPVLALLGCQSPSWGVEADGTIAQGSGPAQLLREDHHAVGTLDRDDADFAVLVLEAERVPDGSLAATVTDRTGVPTSGVFVLVASAASIAGSVAAAAKAAGGVVARVEAAGADPATVRSVVASAPVAPVTEGDAGQRSEAAIGAGGRVHLVVDGGVVDPSRLVDPGIEAATPAPAHVTVDVRGGPTHVVGGVDEDRLAELVGL